MTLGDLPQVSAGVSARDSDERRQHGGSRVEDVHYIHTVIQNGRGWDLIQWKLLHKTMVNFAPEMSQWSTVNHFNTWHFQMN